MYVTVRWYFDLLVKMTYRHSQHLHGAFGIVTSLGEDIQPFVTSQRAEFSVHILHDLAATFLLCCGLHRHGEMFPTVGRFAMTSDSSSLHRRS